MSASDHRDAARPRPNGLPTPGESVLDRAHRALTCGIVAVVLLIAFEATAVGTAMPVAAGELDGVSLYAFAFSAFHTTSLVGMVASGAWSDRRGPVAPLASGIGVFAAGLLLSGTASGMGVFVLGRAVQGFGGGLVIVALYVSVGRTYTEALRPTVMAAFAASWVVPSAVGPLIAGIVTEQLGWRWVFLGIPVLVAVPLAVMLPPLRRAASGPPGGKGTDETAGGSPVVTRLRLALVLATGAALLQYAGQELTTASLVPAALGAALLVPSALRLLPAGTYRAARGLPAVVLLRGLSAASFMVAESFAPLMLVTQRGLSVTSAGLMLAAGGTAWALGSYVQTRAGRRSHQGGLLRTAMVLVAAGLGGTPLVLLTAVPVWSVAVTMTVGCFGMGVVISSTSVLLLRLSSPAEAGRNSAALQTSDSLSNVVLLAATGAAFAALGGGSVGAAAVVHGAGGAGGVQTAAQPLAFVAVFGIATAVAALAVAVTGRVRPPHRTEAPLGEAA